MYEFVRRKREKWGVGRFRGTVAGSAVLGSFFIYVLFYPGGYQALFYEGGYSWQGVLSVFSCCVVLLAAGGLIGGFLGRSFEGALLRRDKYGPEYLWGYIAGASAALPFSVFIGILMGVVTGRLVQYLIEMLVDGNPITLAMVSILTFGFVVMWLLLSGAKVGSWLGGLMVTALRVATKKG